MAKKPFYGYWMLVVGFFCVFMNSIPFYGFGLFVGPIETELVWGRGQIMAGFTIFFLVVGLSSPFIGRIVDRYGVRAVISIGALVAGFGFYVISLSQELWHFYLGWGIIGIGAAAFGLVPATALVTNWFKKRIGTAIGIVTAGIGGGGFVFAPLLGSYLIPNFGWRISCLISGLTISTILIPLTLLLVRTNPADMEVSVDDTGAPGGISGDKALPHTTEGFTLKMALGTLTFWLITVSYAASMFGQIGVLQHEVIYLQDIGFSVSTASTALGTVGLVSLIGKLFFGWLCDQIEARYAYAIGIAFMASALIVLMNLGGALPPGMVWLHVILLGLGAGSWAATMVVLVRNNFGLTAYGTIFGTLTLFHSFSVSIGPIFSGFIRDITGSYSPAFFTFLGLHVVAIFAILLVHHPKEAHNT